MGCTKSKSVEVNNESEPNELIKSLDNPSKNENTILEKSNVKNALTFSYNKENSNNKLMLSNNKVSSYNIKLIKKIKREPFVITTLKSDTDTCKIYIIKINACLFLKEYLIPIWFEKGTYIKFISKGKWRIDKNYEFTDSAGMPSSSNLNFNYGAAVAKIGSGEEFVIPPNNFTYYAKKEGPLYLKINLPKVIKVNPQGVMEIKVFDGILMSYEEINKKIGYKEKVMEYNINYSNDLENDLTLDLNNLRINPVLFYENHIKNKQKSIWIEGFLKKIKNNNDKNGITPFSINNDIYTFINNYIKLKYEYIKKNIIKRNLDKFLEEYEQNISYNIKDEFSYDNIVTCKITKKNNSSDICLLYLFDKNIRKYIFNNKYNFITINIVDSIIVDTYFIILAIMKGENNEEDYVNYK